MRLHEIKKTAGGLHIPESAMQEEVPFPIGVVVAMGECEELEDVKVGDDVAVARVFMQAGFFTFKGKKYALVGHEGVVAVCNDAMAESFVEEQKEEEKCAKVLSIVK